MLRIAESIAFLTLSSVILVSCGKSVKSERKDRGADGVVSGGEDLTVKGAGLPEYCETISSPDQIGDGLADFASALENSLRLISGETALRQLCLRCQPRQLARVQCMKVELGAVNDICSNNLHEIVNSSSYPVVKCRAGNRSDGAVNHAIFDLKPNRMESIISMLPIAALLVENQMAGKFTAGSSQQIIADAAVGFAKNHASGVLLGNSNEQAVDFMVTAITKYLTASSKSLDEPKTIELRGAIGRAFGDMANLAAQSDSLTPEQLQSITARLYEVAPSLQKYQFILPVLFTPGASDLLTEHIGALIPPQSLGELIGLFNVPTSN